MFGDNIAITQLLDPNVYSDGYWRNLLRRSIYRSIYVQPTRNAEKSWWSDPGHLTSRRQLLRIGERLTPGDNGAEEPSRFVDRQVHHVMRNNRLAAVVNIAVSPDDIRVIGAVTKAYDIRQFLSAAVPCPSLHFVKIFLHSQNCRERRGRIIRPC
jgi:hypothetical protein